MGIVNGDTGADVVSKTGTTSAWFSVTVSEGDAGLFGLVDQKFTVTLQSPPGMNFDLYVHSSPCGGALYGQAKGGVGAADVVASGWNETLGTDDSRTVLLEVRYVSGTACASSATWNLKVEGNK